MEYTLVFIRIASKTPLKVAGRTAVISSRWSGSVTVRGKRRPPAVPIQPRALPTTSLICQIPTGLINILSIPKSDAVWGVINSL